MTNQRIRIGKAAEMLGVTVQTMRNWDKSGKLISQRSTGGQRYYELRDIERARTDLEMLGWAWAASGQPPELPREYYCERQDRFTSRLEKMSVVLSQAFPSLGDMVSLLTLVAGEIGDNSFAHNIGNWPDVPGIFYAYDINKRLIVLADRGLGVKTTLSRVKPNIVDDKEALKVAFTEVVSGRDPEKRGNGLKVVRRVAESSVIGLVLRSGMGLVRIPKNPGAMEIYMTNENIRGVYAVITF